jgi:hypothetical protein
MNVHCYVEVKMHHPSLPMVSDCTRVSVMTRRRFGARPVSHATEGEKPPRHIMCWNPALAALNCLASPNMHMTKAFQAGAQGRFGGWGSSKYDAVLCAGDELFLILSYLYLFTHP